MVKLTITTFTTLSQQTQNANEPTPNRPTKCSLLGDDYRPSPGGRVPTHVSGRMPETGAWWPFRVLGYMRR